MDAWFGPVHDATVGVLSHAGYRVVVPEQQTCCGALAAHDGQVREAQKLAKTNVVAFADADVIISNSAGCSAHLKEYSRWAPGGEDVQTRTRDITEFVAGLIADGVLPSMTEHRGDVAVQDPCHLRHAQRILAEPRAILRAAGYRPLDIDVDGLCCGAAGIYSVLHAETSNELGRRKAREIEASGSQLVASANPGCEMQLRAQLPAGTRVAHPIEIYWEALTASGVRSR
jgi:glycolate oxidase iron-sulfur subunit